MEIIYFTLVGIAIYLLANRILLFIEDRQGAPLKNRNLMFFVIFLGLALPSFQLIQYFMRTGGAN